MHLRVKNRWRPELVTLVDYANDCEYWRQGVSLHVLRQNISDAQKETVNKPEFSGPEDLDAFKEMNAQESLLCQSSTSSSEVTEQLLRDCMLEDDAIANVDFIIFCHSSVDLEFYSSPACRAQNALGNQKILPFSVAQCGTVAGLYGLELANVLGEQSPKGVVLALNDLGIMPARRRAFKDVFVNDGCSILHIAPDSEGEAGIGNLKIKVCETKQFSVEPTLSSDLLPAFAELIAQANEQIGCLEGMMTILPKYSKQFQDNALNALPKGPDYVFENTDGGYSGVNFAYNALDLISKSKAQSALLLQISETGGGAFCALQKDQ